MRINAIDAIGAATGLIFFLATSSSLVAALLVPVDARGQEPSEAAGHEAGEVEEIIVQATRSRRRVQDEALRVEVLSQEEIEEKLLMRPGNIS